MKPKVFLTGADNVGWALDEDMRLTRIAISDIVELTDFDNCDIVHSMWWSGLKAFNKESLLNKRVVANVAGEPLRILKSPRIISAMSVVDLWVTRTSEAKLQFDSLKIPNVKIPYTIDTAIFRELASNDRRLDEFKTNWNIPEDKYLVGSFQRDTLGFDLASPKLLKGPDIFAEILRGLLENGYSVHAVIAGPRRYWLRERLTELGVPFTYIGQDVVGDDIGPNTLPRTTLNLLYNLVDLYIVSSRSEGGPFSILEAASSRCKITSTRVGLAHDVLDTICCYDSIVDGISIVEQDIEENILDATLDDHFKRVHASHKPEAVAHLYRELYDYLESTPISKNYPRKIEQSRKSKYSFKFLRRLFPVSKSESLTVGMWHRFHDPPWGGGNQFMMALRKAFIQKGIRVIVNHVDGADVHILQAVGFDVEKFLKKKKSLKSKIIHRVDGPISLIRGTDRELDDLCFQLNKKTNATVVQSAWCYQRLVEMGYKPINPVIIHNAVDSNIFHPHRRIEFNRERKIRLVSTSWSGNPRKGGPIYKWIDENLDWDRFEYTFVGNVSERLNNISHVPPVPSLKLANILRQHDIYITASQSDPCSNALIEALSCGLPAIYINDGGHPELVQYGGLPFNKVDEIPRKIDIVVDNYEKFKNLIAVQSLDEVADKYLTLIKEVKQELIA